MSNKNKKIKIKCPHCGERNKFAKKNWLGAEKTKCKYCGEILANIKEYEIPITKVGSSKQEPKLNESLQEVTRPALYLCEKGSKKKTWVLISIALIFVIASAFLLDNKDKNTLEEVNDLLNNSDLTPPTTQEFCSKIKSVPAWCQDGEIIDYGYKPGWNVTYLIENKICFLYLSTCSWCHKQIEGFGSQWALYIYSGYTQEC